MAGEALWVLWPRVRRLACKGRREGLDGWSDTQMADRSGALFLAQVPFPGFLGVPVFRLGFLMILDTTSWTWVPCLELVP